MRKILVVLVMTMCGFGVARASGRAADQQSNQMQQTEMQGNKTENQVMKDDCSAKAKRDKKYGRKKQVRSNDPQEESPSPQNQIEYGGGG
jgi:hypothetical protein